MKGGVTANKARVLEAYKRSPKGTSLRRFCQDNPDFPTYQAIMRWQQDDAEFRGRLARARSVLFAGYKAKRKPPQVAVPQVEVRSEEPKVSIPDHPVPEVPVEQPLTDRQKLWLSRFVESEYDTIDACRTAAITYAEFREMISKKGPFATAYSELEAEKEQRVADQWTRLAIRGEDRQAVERFLKYKQSPLIAPQTGEDGGGLNILTAGLAAARKKWSTQFPASLQSEGKVEL